MFSLREKKTLVTWGLLALIALFGILYFAGRKPKSGGAWICRNGQWIAEGRPSVPAPKAKCY